MQMIAILMRQLTPYAYWLKEVLKKAEQAAANQLSPVSHHPSCFACVWLVRLPGGRSASLPPPDMGGVDSPAN